MGDVPARALLLAAGRGERLGPRGRQTAKCLLEFGGRSLLARHLQILGDRGAGELCVVTGYRQAEVAAEFESLSDLRGRVVFNARYDRGSIVSLWCARERLRAGGEVLLMDADVLYAPTVVDPLWKVPGTGLLLDRDCDLLDPEPVKVCLRGGRVVEFSKQVAAGLKFDAHGESVGFFRLSERAAAALADEVELRVDAGRLDEPYEAPLREVLLADPSCRVHDVSGLPWIEIDFAGDIERAQREILPRLTEGEL